MFWIIAGLMVLATAAIVVTPLLWRRAGATEAGQTERKDYDLAVYQDQLRELDADMERGQITPALAASARIEIERRMLKAVDRPEAVSDGAPPSHRLLSILLAIGLPIFAILLYMRLGSPDMPDHPFDRHGADEVAQAAKSGEKGENLEALVEKLVAYLKQHPESAEGWMHLRESLSALGDNPRAARLLAEAVAVHPKDLELRVTFGESLVAMSDGQVSPAARLVFEQAATLEPGHPGVRYYLALGKFQRGDVEGAYNDWVALAKDSPPNAPWAGIVNNQIQTAAARLGRAGPAAPQAEGAGPTAEQRAAIEAMNPADRDAMIRGMVQQLADRLKTQPGDYQGWIRLARAYAVLGDMKESLNALRQVQKAAPPDLAATIATEIGRLEAVSK